MRILKKAVLCLFFILVFGGILLVALLKEPVTLPWIGNRLESMPSEVTPQMLPEPGLPAQPEATAPEGDDGSSVQGGELFITSEEMTVFNDLSIWDKMIAFSIVQKLGEGDTQAIYGMLEDGVTYTEMENIRQILGKSLPPDVLKQLEDLLLKYKHACSQPD